MSDNEQAEVGTSMGRGRGRTKLNPEFLDGGGRRIIHAHQKKESPKRFKTDNRLYPAWMTKNMPVTKQGKPIGGGMPVTLQANYLRLNTAEDYKFYQYVVQFEPENDVTGIRRRWFHEAIALNHPGIGFIYNGDQMLFTCNQSLNTPVRHSAEFRGVKFTVTVTEAAGGKVLSMREDSEETIPILNTIVRNAMGKLKLTRVRRDLFDSSPEAIIKMKDLKLQIWPGYITSIREHEHDRLMCVELAHKIIRDENCLDIFRSTEVQSTSDPQTRYKELMLGSVVMTLYNNKDYKICDVDFKQSPASTFKKKDGTEISFKDYYAQRYSLTNIDLHQPILLSKVTRRVGAEKTDDIIALIPQLVRPTGLTEKFRSNFINMKMLNEKTQLVPQERRSRILRFRQRILDNPEASRELSSRQIELGELVEFPGRTLPHEQIVFGQNAKFNTDEKVDWTNGFRNNKLYATESVKRWMVVVPRNCEGDARQFIQICKKVSAGMGIDIAEPAWEIIENDRVTTYADKIENCCGRDPRIIFVVVPNNNADRYSAIKKITCVNQAIPTQVILKKNTFSKKGPSGLMSIATKVMIQMVCKLGGAPWMINLPVQGTMTIGFDVTHGKTSGVSYGTKSPSYGAFVASMDLQKVVKYYSGVVEHRSGEEISGKLGPQVQRALATFQRFHQCLPKRIIFYRDGVGSGQMQAVIDNEIEAVKQTMKSAYGEAELPKFTFIVVNKRLNTRIFMKNNGTCQNPLPGTIADDVITNPYLYDFYLISQSVRIGTVAPTSYTVLESPYEDSLDATRLQYFTWKMCHLYYNWSGTLRVPAVVQYAHKLSVLVGEALKTYPHQKWGDIGSLYFL